ncbi:MAG TPA: hypothetical protein VII42_13955 [Caulobacteraceae bacterium]
MKLTDTPDLTSNRRLILLGVVLAIGVCVVLAITEGQIGKTLGDTDDAMRLVMVRDLLHGRGWYDQLVTRLQPPQVVYMHWSRLLDGALAACLWLAEQVTSVANAEFAVRFVWPLLWIAPVVIACLSIARSLGGKLALFACALLMVTNSTLFVQFRPGRIDHHNIQITMAVLAVACAMARTHRVRFAAVAGVATALGLAIGIEALAFQAIAGASFALSAALDRDEAKPARAYGLALVAATLGFYVLQTPFDRWALPLCDALGANLVGAILVAGLGLAVFATWGARFGLAARFAQLAVVGALAAGVYIAANPACLHGPFAAVDPRLRPIWFDHISELESWPRLFKQHRDNALISIFMSLMGAAAAALLLAVRWRKWDRPTLLAAALMGVAAVAAAHAWRMEDYAFWFGIPTLAAAIGWLSGVVWRGALVTTMAASLVLSPMLLAVGLDEGLKLIPAKPAAAQARGAAKPAANKPDISDECFEVRAYGPLATLPPGVVLGEVDLGPFILAHTRDSVLAAPYHRMSWGIWKAYEALGGPSSLAQARLKALNVAYVADCQLNPLRVNPKGFEGDLRRGHIPDWMERLTAPNQIIQIYRMKSQGG